MSGRVLGLGTVIGFAIPVVSPFIRTGTFPVTWGLDLAISLARGFAPWPSVVDGGVLLPDEPEFTGAAPPLEPLPPPFFLLIPLLAASMWAGQSTARNL
mgnify:CR=1 FL=1